MIFPKIRLVIVPIIRKGPNGITPPRSVRFRHIISMRDAAAPVKNAMYKAKKQFGHPKNNPIKNANLISPIPIPRPKVIRCKNKKKPAHPMPESSAVIKKGVPKNIENRNAATISGNSKKSGIISCHKSIKKIQSKFEKIKM